LLCLGLVKKTTGLPLFLSLYSLSFPFSQGSEGLDDIRVVMVKEEEDNKKGLETAKAILGREAKVCGGTISNVLRVKLKEMKRVKTIML
jgi:hypothetical protein